MSASRLLNSVYNVLWLCWGGLSLRRTFVLPLALAVFTAGALTGAAVEANAFLVGKQTFATRAFVDQHGVVYQSVAVRGIGGFEPGFKRAAGQFVDAYSQLDSGPNRRRSDRNDRRTRSRSRVVRPTVSNLSLHSLGGARVAGRCAPSHRVLISLDGRMSRSVTCGRDGRFVAELEEPFGAGEHLVATSVRLNSGNVRLGQDVRVFIPEGFEPTGFAPDRQTVVPDVRDYAEELAQAASERFSQLTQPEVKTPSAPQTEVPVQESAGGNQTVPAASESKAPTVDSSDGPYKVLSDRLQWGVDEVGSWQRHSIDTYFRKVVPKLSTGSSSAGEGGGENASTLADVPLPSRPVGTGVIDSLGVGISSYFSRARDWLERANKDYQERVVRSLSVPDGDGGVKQVATDELPSPVDVPETAKVVPRDDVVRQGEREVVGSPSGRLAVPSQISASNAASQGEAARLKRDLANQGAQIVLPDRAPDKTVAADVGRSGFLEQDRAAQEKKRLAELKAQKERSRFEEQRRGEAERTTANRDKKRKQERTAARLKAQRLAEAKQAKARERQVELARLEEERRLAEVKAETLRAAQRQAGRDTGRDAPRKRKLGENTVVLPSRSPDRSTTEQADLGSSERSALGARDVDLPVRKQKSARKRSVVKPRAKSRRARRSKKARRVAVRSYRARRKAKKRRLRRGRKMTTYVVRRGDTLWDIARRYYGAGHRYKRIHRANRRKIRNPHLIWPRQRIRIPGSRR